MEVGNKASNASCGVITWKVSVVPEAPGDSDAEAAGYVSCFKFLLIDTSDEGEVGACTEAADDVDGIDGLCRAGLSVTDL